MNYINKWFVTSSSGRRYTVSLKEDGDYECGCRGWTMHTPRRDCKHIRELKEVREGAEPTMEIEEQLV